FHVASADRDTLYCGSFCSHFLARLVVGKPGSGWNQTTHHNVLLQTTEEVALACHGSLGQHPGGFLEGSRRDKGLGCQGRLGDTEQHTLEMRLDLALITQL